MSIRWKLFLTLFLLTGGVTAVVLVIAEREFQNWVKEEVGKRFEDQVEGLLASRTERLTQIRSLCQQLAEEDALKMALRDRDKNAGRERREGFLKRYMELRGAGAEAGGPKPGIRGGSAREGGPGRTNPATGRPPGPGRPGMEKDKPGAGGGAPGQDLPVMGVIDLDGEVKHFGRVVEAKGKVKARRAQAVTRLKELSPKRTQEVAYLVLEEDGAPRARSRVQELVVTPVRENDGSMLGWLFLGREADTRVDLMFQRAEETSGRDGRSGMVVDGQWFLRGVSREEAAHFAASVSDDFWTRGRPEVVKWQDESFLMVATDLNPDSPLGKGYQVTVFPIGSLIAGVARLRVLVLSIGAGGVVVAALVAFLLAQRFNRPIAELLAGTERVRLGDFAGEVHVRSSDELGRLAGAFNTMTRDLALKERYREVLSKVSDPGVAQRLVEGDLELGGEVREAAVLFCDIRGFTAMTEGMPPSEVIELINEHMTAMTKLVYLHGGVVDKFVGDLIMAIFGVPTSGDNDAARAARCALEMMEERQLLNDETGRVIQMGIGLAYGELVAGCMGSEDRLNYTVLGDRVNLASRLCSAAAAGEVLIDGQVAAAVGDQMKAVRREAIELKGFSEPVEIFELRE